MVSKGVNSLNGIFTGNIAKTNYNRFLVYANNQSNVTGDNTQYTIAFANTVVDSGSRWSTDTYTIPVGSGGTWLFIGQIALQSTTVGTTYAIYLKKNATLYTLLEAGNLYVSPTELNYAAGISLSVSAGDTIKLLLQVFGSSKDTSIVGGAQETSFGGVQLG